MSSAFLFLFVMLDNSRWASASCGLLPCQYPHNSIDNLFCVGAELRLR